MNIRGIKSKIKEIISIMEDVKLDIMIFSETKLINEEKRKLPGYKSYSLNRSTPAGGVVIYYKETLKVEEIKRNKENESIWIKVKMEEKELAICALYSPCEYTVSQKRIEEISQ